MRPTQAVIDAFIKDEEGRKKVDFDLAAAMVLRSIARTYEEEANDILRKACINIGEAKQYASQSDKAFATYINFMNKCRVDCGNDFVTDYDKIMGLVEEHAPELLKAIIKYIN